MRKLSVFLIALLQVSPAYSDICRSDQKLAIIGTMQSDDASISSTAQEVRAIVVNCGGSACTAGLYDTATLGGALDSNQVIEVGGAANTMVVFPQNGVLPQPLTFSSGITFFDDGNVSTITLYSCQDR